MQISTFHASVCRCLESESKLVRTNTEKCTSIPECEEHEEQGMRTCESLLTPEQRFFTTLFKQSPEK